MALSRTALRQGGLVFAARLLLLAPASVNPIWAGPVYNVTELRTLSGASLDTADLVSMYYAGFRFAPPDGQATDTAIADANAVVDANAPELPVTIGPDALAAEAGSGDRLFPVDGFLSGDTEAVLYTTGFTRRDTFLFTPAGQLAGVPCDRSPSGLALALCPPPEHPENAAENTRGFRCALYTQAEAPPGYLCASPGDR